jgi:DNA-binding protein
MKKLLLLVLVALCFCCSGCYYPGINGKVYDNATGKPIEGAVVVAQWTKPRGIPGMQYHNLHKITETLTDKEGKFSLSGTIGVLIDPPEMIIYKEGYIPWRNDAIFPSCNLVKKNEWENNVMYRLDVYTNAYTYSQIDRFLNYGIMGHSDAPFFYKISNKVSVVANDESRLQRDKH